MDTATERVFVGHLEKALKPEQTLIVATHRNATLALVNRVVVLENGSVALDGPRDAVLKRLSENQLRPRQRSLLCLDMSKVTPWLAGRLAPYRAHSS
jgi:ABC-type bacteriocin/lantibiotic exporter with double-glycine peptidase domain